METLLVDFENLPVWSKALWLVSCLGLAWILEALIPLRSFDYRKIQHVLLNLRFLLVIIPINLGFGLLLATAVLRTQHYQLGLFDQFSLSLVSQLVITVLALDLISQYGTHVCLHKLGWLWRLHMIHHSDTTMDASTGTRHHPLDYVCREITALLTVVVLGAPVAFYAIYRLATIFFTYFTHANIRLPKQMDRALSWIFISPDMHKFHHHFRRPWTDSNYGNIFSFWDRLFNTLVYDDVRNVQFGLDQLQGTRHRKAVDRFWFLLKLPFVIR